jgi:hypothetical protein
LLFNPAPHQFSSEADPGFVFRNNIVLEEKFKGFFHGIGVRGETGVYGGDFQFF